MEFADLIEIRELVQYQHVVAAVACLGERPMRYGELGTAISEWTGSRIADGELTRTVRRLEAGGLVKVVPDNDGHRLFMLTPEGHNRRKKAAALGKVLRSWTGD
ncbi:hypothetical protein ACIBMZ_26680 [Micromonospora sp. NPDC049900]|uniref:hypothetical protein n=1 Tax=Micromonospora sp. NPDC049900 TaxID=3364275 RepID=UPI0037B6B1CF